MTAAELADIAGESVEDAVMMAVIESAKGTRRESAILSILGKDWRSRWATKANPSRDDYSKTMAQTTFDSLTFNRYS